jgi:hypothetical protein
MAKPLSNKGYDRSIAFRTIALQVVRQNFCLNLTIFSSSCSGTTPKKKQLKFISIEPSTPQQFVSSASSVILTAYHLTKSLPSISLISL